MNTISFQRLSPPRQRLVRLMQAINFGRIERLLIRDGEPVYEPPPRIVRTLKLGCPSGCRDEVDLDDFTVKREAIDLLQHLEAVRNALIPFIDVRHGLPLVMEIEEILSN